MKKRIRIIAGVTGAVAAIATGVYASWKWNTKYRNYKQLKEEIDALPYEIERIKIV